MTKEAIAELSAKIDELLRDPSRRRWLSVADAATYSAVSEETIRTLISSGKLTGHRPVGGRVILDRLEIDTFLSSATNSPRHGRGIRR